MTSSPLYQTPRRLAKCVVYVSQYQWHAYIEHLKKKNSLQFGNESSFGKIVIMKKDGNSFFSGERVRQVLTMNRKNGKSDQQKYWRKKATVIELNVHVNLNTNIHKYEWIFTPSEKNSHEFW